VDSRAADDGGAIRRRRHCEACGQRFTTFERLEERALVVRKRSGRRVPFERRKIIAGLVAATKGRPVDYDAIEGIALAVEDEVRRMEGVATTEHVGLSVLEHLRHQDQVAYLRFASVYKGFDDVEDFARELRLLESRPSAAEMA
jgi:transcriptional repressor NrdR